MRYDRVFSVAMPGKLQIIPFCAPQRMDAEIPAAAHSDGSARVLPDTPCITQRDAACRRSPLTTCARMRPADVALMRQW
jgi:hypothetical protein